MASKVIIGSYKTLAQPVAGSEAEIDAVQTRLQAKVEKSWVNLHTLRANYPAWEALRAAAQGQKTHKSPFGLMVGECPTIPQNIEKVEAFCVAPQPGQELVTIDERDVAKEKEARDPEIFKIYTDASDREGNFGIGVSIYSHGQLPVEWGKKGWIRSNLEYLLG